MKALCCVSDGASGLTPKSLEQRLFQAAERNRQRRITGFLGVGETVFLDLIEGPSDAVDRLCAELVEDGERRDLRVLWERNASHREFDRWSMVRLERDFVRQLMREVAAADEAAAFAAMRPDDLIDCFQLGLLRSGGAEFRFDEIRLC